MFPQDTGLIGLMPPDPSAGVLPLNSEPGVGAGAIFATGLVIYLSAYLNIVEVGGIERQGLRRLLLVALVPLVATFLGILLFETLAVIGLDL